MQAQDQQNKRPEQAQTENRANREAQVKQDLGLTDVQSTEWDRIHDQYRSRARSVRNSNEMDETAKKSKMKELKKFKNDNIEALLSPEQKNKWEEMKKEKRARKHGGKHEGEYPSKN